MTRSELRAARLRFIDKVHPPLEILGFRRNPVTIGRTRWTLGLFAGRRIWSQKDTSHTDIPSVVINVFLEYPRINGEEFTVELFASPHRADENNWRSRTPSMSAMLDAIAQAKLLAQPLVDERSSSLKSLLANPV